MAEVRAPVLVIPNMKMVLSLARSPGLARKVNGSDDPVLLAMPPHDDAPSGLGGNRRDQRN